MTALLPVIEAGLRLSALIIEGIPVEQRRAQSLIWFHLWWPATKLLLKAAKAPDDVIDAIEAAMKNPA